MANTTSITNAKKTHLPWLVFLLGLIVSLLVVLVGWRLQHFVSSRPDPYGYAAMGHSLARGEGFSHYGSVLARRGPLYPAFIALLTLLFGETPLPVQLAQCLLHAGTCVLAFDVGRRIYNERTGIVAGVVCALHPSLLRYVPDLHIETFLAILFTLILWTTVRFQEKPTPQGGALIGIAGGLAALAKPVALPYPVLFALWWVFLWIRRRREAAAETRPLPWRSVAAIFLALAAVVLPWTYRNYRSSGHFVLITTGVADAYLRGLVFSRPEFAVLRKPPYTDAENESNAWFRALCAQDGTVWERNDIETEQILSREAKHQILTDPASFLRKFVTGLFTFWYQMTSRINSLAAGMIALISWLLALVGWRRSRREGQPAWLLFLPILYLNVVLAALLALGRYSLPILPALTVLAAFGVDTLWGGRWASRRDERAKP